MEGSSSNSSSRSRSTVIADLQGLLEQLTGTKESLPKSLVTTYHHHQLLRCDVAEDDESSSLEDKNQQQQQQQQQQTEDNEEQASRVAAAALNPAKWQQQQQQQQDHADADADAADDAGHDDAEAAALALFERHIGPYAHVLDCATRHVEIAVDDGIMLFKNIGNNRRWGGSLTSIERYNHPTVDASCNRGPRPDFCIWIGLFLGREAETAARQQYEKDVNNNAKNNNETDKNVDGDESDDDDDENSPPYTNVYHILVNDVPKLHVLELARNILRYLRQESESLQYSSKLQDRWKMLRFCAIYGLSGAVTDVLAGRYEGAVVTSSTTAPTASTTPISKLTVDTPLPVVDEASTSSTSNNNLASENGRFSRRNGGGGGPAAYAGGYPSGSTLCLPVIGIAAVLGYTHLVRHAHAVLGANVMDAIVTCQCNTTGNIMDIMQKEGDDDCVLGTHVMDVPHANILNKGHLSLARLLLLWSILKNQPAMVKCLVTDVGFQFRWMTQKEGSHDGMKDIFKTLFLTNDGYRDDEGIWRGRKYDHEEYMWDRRKNRHALIKHSYRERQGMLKTLIALGLPQNLLVPVIDVSIDARLKQQARDQGVDLPTKELIQQVNLRSSRTEGKARGLIYEACAQYNQVVKRKDTLDMIDFYTKYISNLWGAHQPGGDVVVQQERLPEYEKLDPRWEMVADKGQDGAFAPWWRSTSTSSGADHNGDDDEESSSDEDGGFNDLSDDNGNVSDFMVPIYHHGDGDDESNSDMEEEDDNEEESEDDDE